MTEKDPIADDIDEEVDEPVNVVESTESPNDRESTDVAEDDFESSDDEEEEDDIQGTDE